MTTPDAPPPSSKSPALAPLRAIYRATRAGAPIDPQALMAAVGYAAAADVDTFSALRAFEPHALIFPSRMGGTDGAYMLRTALTSGGWHAAIRMASLLGWTDVWASAMTAYHGPTGTHASRLDAHGCPTAETLAEFPELDRRMAEAAERFHGLLGWYERHAEETRWEYVVTMRKAA